MTGLPPARPARRRRSPGWVPNQHGAWAMLASPLLLGALATGLHGVHALLALFWFAGYFAFFATSVWLKSGRKARFRQPVWVYVALAALAGAALAATRPGLLWFAALFVGPLGVGLWAAAQRRERDLLAGLTTVLGSALMTIVAYAAPAATTAAAPALAVAALDGELRRPLLLAVGQFLYFGGTVCYVKSMIRERGNARFLALSVGWHVLAVVVVATWSPWLALVFALLTVRAWVVPRFALSPKQIGIAEIVSTLAVALVSLATTS